MILAFRTNVPSATPAKTPVTINLISQARAIQELVVFSNTSTLNISKQGFRLLDRSAGGRLLIPDAGSWGQENFAAADETNWAAIPPSPLRLDMNEQIIEGPPWQLTLQFYNIDAAALLVAGYAIVREPFAELPFGEMYEFLTRLGPATKEAGASDMPLIPEKQRTPEVNVLVDRIINPTPFEALAKKKK